MMAFLLNPAVDYAGKWPVFMPGEACMNMEFLSTSPIVVASLGLRIIKNTSTHENLPLLLSLGC